MTNLTRFALVAGALLIGASSAIAAPANRFDNSARAVQSRASSNGADPYAGHNPNSPEGNRAYWDYQGRHGN
jgi:hypothetical protein